VLVRNGRNINQNPAKFSGSVWGDSGNRFKASLRNRDAGGFESAFSAYPSGHLSPGAFALPKSSGALSSTTLSRAVISGALTLVAGRNLNGSAGLVITATNAQLDQIVSAVVSGSISISAVSAILAGAANMTASGTLAITVNSALIGAIFSVTASGASSVDANAELTAKAFMEAAAGGAPALSPAGLSTELLDNNEVEAGFSLRESMRLMLASLAGKVSGAGTSTITIRSATDGSNRITATVDASGNRTAVTHNVGDE